MILMSNEERDQRVIAGLSAGQDMGVFEVSTYLRGAFVDGGYLYPLDSVVKSIGPEQFAPGTRVVSGGHDWVFPYATAPHALWGRNDRVANTPKTWDDFLAAAKANTGNGRYGGGFAIGLALAFDLIFPAFVWAQGADYFDPQGNVIFGSDQARQGIQNYVDLLKYCPPNASNWAAYENINAYYSGRCAMAHFNGRLGDNIHNGAPQLEGITWCSHLPGGPIKVANTFVSYLGVDAKGSNPELAAEFVQFLLTGANGVAYANSGPGLLTPSVKSVRDAAVSDTSNPILQKHADWFKVMADEINIAIDVGGPMGQMATGSFKPYDAPGCPWAGTAWGDHSVDMQMIQKIVLGGLSVKDGQSWAVDQYKGIVKDYKSKHPSWKPYSG
jgi:multiple sugar transport system substrate-binding protein